MKYSSLQPQNGEDVIAISSGEEDEDVANIIPEEAADENNEDEFFIPPQVK